MSANLQSRIERIQANLQSGVVQETHSFMRWLESLTIEDHANFLEFFIREMFPGSVLPAGKSLLDVPVDERKAWLDEFVKRRRAEEPLTESEELAFHVRVVELRNVWLSTRRAV